ncbi:MAG: MBL fold metallo-hydrolase [Anaerovoracaceae bacterium]|jgi:glyoxylase-like metal-dependent hydrolase (beta-lactamase superfamily II)
MTEKLMENLYMIEIPLPRNPLKTLNSYLIKGDDRNLLIDTGFNREECFDTITSALDELDVDLNRTDIFITHMHADHSGLAARLMGEGSLIYCSGVDGDIINSSNKGEYWDRLEESFYAHGLPEDVADRNNRVHPGWVYRTGKDIDFTIVEDGDVLEVGDYSLKCVHTPGHTAGHMCLYDGGKQMLFSGDHILGDITPVISIGLAQKNPLGSYMESLNRIEQLPIKNIFSAHRRRIADPYKRIEEIRKHHGHRLEEILKILQEGPKSAYETAAKMTWDIWCKSWDDFPPQQKWFATGEAAAHLLYLWYEKKIDKVEVKKGRLPCHVFKL